ncbi:hypothetical protein [Microbulbifer elongatus]|nr:hypothetical protein [Microbulbifer elongatus]
MAAVMADNEALYPGSTRSISSAKGGKTSAAIIIPVEIVEQIRIR